MKVLPALATREAGMVSWSTDWRKKEKRFALWRGFICKTVFKISFESADPFFSSRPLAKDFHSRHQIGVEPNWLQYLRLRTVAHLKSYFISTMHFVPAPACRRRQLRDDHVKKQ
jgi:hypothetical protein